MSRGHNRERDVQDLLEADGWMVTRAAGSLGMFDLVALKTGHTPRAIEVKSTAQGPYERFGPEQRRACIQAAHAAGAVAQLAWWPPTPPGRRKADMLKWIHPDDWPAGR